jgi:hypothetical protein
MKFEELFKDVPEDVMKTINTRLEASGAKFKDISGGDYVDKNKFNSLKNEFDTYKETSEETKKTQIDEINNNNSKAMTELNNKFKGIVKSKSIDNFINSLGVKNEYEVIGLKTKLNSNEEITVDDDYNLVGADDVFNTIRKSYDTAETKVVGTINGSAVKQSESGTAYTLKSLENMSDEQYQANKEQIIKDILAKK